MKITWYGHSSFLLTAESGVSVLTDPCDRETGYHLHDIRCSAVTISHDHHDHNCIDSVLGNPPVFRTAGAHEIGDIRITGYPSFHDAHRGAKRGANLLFLYEIDGMRILHLGDLGHMLSDELIEQIGTVDVLLAPIGGVYTIGADTATEIADRLNAHVLVPMHYKTPNLHFDVAGLEPLLSMNTNRSVHSLNADTVTLTCDTLGESRLLILDYRR